MNNYSDNLTEITTKIKSIKKLYLTIENTNIFSNNNEINVDISSKLLLESLY
jgi:hypothetical protein